MDFFTGSNDIGTLALGLVMAGAVAGFVTGAIGAGAGLVLVPSLYLVLTAMGVNEDLRMHVAVGTALAAMLPVSLAMIAAGPAKIDAALMKRAGVMAISGAAAGAAISAWLPGYWLTLSFAALALAAAAFMAFVKEEWTPRTARPTQGIAAGFDLGLVATVTGMGLDRRALRLIGRAGEEHASVLSAAVTATAAFIAILAGWELRGLPTRSAGYVNLLALAVVVLPMLGGAFAGRHFAAELDAKRLRRTFALFVVVIAAKMLWDVLG